LFYFYYISNQEDNAILSNLLSLTNSISYKCELLPIEYRNEIIEILKTINNTEYYIALDNRILENKDLFNYSMNYVYSFLIIVGVLGVILGYFHNNRLKWKIMIMDTFIMIFILGIFEYNFFINIVKRYAPITKEELEFFYSDGECVGIGHSDWERRKAGKNYFPLFQAEELGGY